MSKQEWSELALVGGAAIYYGMSYGNYVAAGMPDLERFKRAVEKGEFDPTPVRARTKKGTLLALAAKDSRKVRPKAKLKEDRKNLTCKRCGSKFDAISNLGPVPTYCPACKELQHNEQRKIHQKAYRERKKVGELLA